MHPDDDVDPEQVDADQRYIEGINAGDDAGVFAQWRREVRTGPLTPISGWVEDPAAPSGWRWVSDLAQLPHMADPTAATPAAPGPGVNDHLVQRTDNGLRPDDLTLPQPPQDPRWRPDGDR